MADKTHIEWCDATWNPITGCTVTSPGCTNCYAMRLAGTRLKHHPSRKGLTQMTKAGPVWTGEVRLNEEWLLQPLMWKKPRRIFVCAHGDLFHENVRDEWIDKVFAVMALCPQHTFQVLTKRAHRMSAYINASWENDRINCEAGMMIDWLHMHEIEWPLPNVWLGVSVEDQTRANERIPHLLETPAAVRFVSAEPLLGPIDFTNIDLTPSERSHAEPSGLTRVNALTGEYADDENGAIPGIIDDPDPRINWIIVGGESGPNARDMDPEWAREIRDDCKAVGTALFVKQMARKSPIPADLRIREFPG